MGLEKLSRKIHGDNFEEYLLSYTSDKKTCFRGRLLLLKNTHQFSGEIKSMVSKRSENQGKKKKMHFQRNGTSLIN